MLKRKQVGALAIACGLFLFTGAWWGTAESLEKVFLGTYTGRLAWGPRLFRLLLIVHGAILTSWGSFRFLTAGRVVPDSACHEPVARHSNSSRFIMVILVLVALALRLYRLDLCLWVDEVLTVVQFLSLPLRELVTTFPSQNQHMLYSVAARVSTVVLNDQGAMAVRLPAVLFGAASVYALFLLGRAVVDSREALWACAIMVVSYHHVWFSQNARGYTGLLLFSTIATLFWLEAGRTRRVRTWIGYVVAICLGMWTHLTMIFVVAAHALVLVIDGALGRFGSTRDSRSASSARDSIMAWILAGTITLQGYALSLPEFLRSALAETSRESDWTSLGWVFRETFRRLGDAGAVGLVALVGLVVLTAGWWDLVKRNWRVGVVLIAPAVLGGGTMVVLGHNLWPRFFFNSMGFLLLMAVHGATLVSRTVTSVLPRERRALATRRWADVMCALVVGASLVRLPAAFALPKQDFTGARDYVERLRQPGDEVVATGLAGDVYSRYFAPGWRSMNDPLEIEPLLAGHKEVWLVYTQPIHLKAWAPDAWALVQREFVVDRVFPGSLGDGEVFVCVRKQPPGVDGVDSKTGSSGENSRSPG